MGQLPDFIEVQMDNYKNKDNDEKPFLERLMETEYEKNRPQLPDFIEVQRDNWNR